MSLDEIEEREQSVFKAAGHEFDYPIATLLRRRISETVLKELGISRADFDGNPDMQDEYIEKLKVWVRGIILDMKYKITESVPTDSLRQPVKGQPGKEKKIRPKQFNQRFRKVLYITDWLIHTHRNCVNWPQVTTQWNKENPSDQYENPSSLERLYNKARKENGIMVQLLTLKVLEGTKENRRRLFSEAFHYLDNKDRDIEFARHIMNVYGIKYEVREGVKRGNLKEVF